MAAHRIASIVWMLAAIPAFFVAVSSAFLFDAPGSENSPLTLFAAFGLVALPLVCLIAGVGGFICSFAIRGKSSALPTIILASLPLMNLAYIGALFLLISVFCDGRFACND